MTNVVIIVLALLIWLAPARALAAGFAVSAQGTAPFGQGNAFVAQANDPSAIFYNPAGISQLEGTNAYGGMTLPNSTVDYDSGLTEIETESKWSVLPQLYLTHRVARDVTVGIGLFAPFAVETRWPDTWPGRYLSTSSDLETLNINPVISWKPVPKLSVAAGFNVLWADAELQRKINLAGIGLPDGNQTFKGDDYGYGYNFGLLYRFNPALSFGLAYRSEIKVKADGEAEYTVPSVAAGSFPNGGAHAQVTLPPTLTAGLAWSPGVWTFEFDVNWTGWSTFDELRINLDRPVGVPPISTIVQPRNWNDVLAYRFGINYRWNRCLVLRGGYMFDRSPVPDETFDPTFPDADRHLFCLGGDYNLKSWKLGLAYSYLLGEERDKNNAVGSSILPGNNRADGEYQQTAHVLAFSASYHF